MSKIEWTIDDHNQSLAQGWCIQQTVEENSIKIIKNSELDDFASNRQAFKHVLKMAKEGSAFHQKALKFFEENRDSKRDHIHSEDCTEYYCNFSDENCPVGIGYMETARSIKRDGDHASHCCKHCGCKYGEEDCPVVLGYVESRYQCEESHVKTFTMNADEVKQAINQLEVFRNYFHLNEETFYNEPFKKMLKFHRGNG